MADTLYTYDANSAAAYAALTNSSDLNAFDSVRAQLESYGLGELANTVLDLVKTYGSDMKESIQAALRETPAYKQRFAGNEARKAAGLSVLNEAEYLYNERIYAETLKSYNSGDLATRSNFADFIGKDISPAELSNRFSMAVEKVQKADPALKAQLQQMYPGVSDSDLARSLLMGNEGSQFLKSKIGQAEILAEASTAGLTGQISASELEQRGITRQQAGQAYQQIAQVKSGMQQAANIYGDNVQPDQLQKELESEALLGQQSKRSKRLASQARGAFGGQSGITTGSLGKKNNSQL